MKRILGICLLAVFAATGCATPRCDEVRMRELVIPGIKSQRVYEAADAVLGKYFDLAYEDATAGVVTTQYSQTKSPEDGIVKIRAIAVVTEDTGVVNLNVKVVKERFVERWDIWGQNIIEEDHFLGADKGLEVRIMNEIELALGDDMPKPTAAVPAPAPVAPVTAPAPAAPAPAKSTPSRAEPPPIARDVPGGGSGSLGPPPGVINFPPAHGTRNP